MATSIIKCYDTEENAVNGDITGLIASHSTVANSYPFAFTVNSIGNAIYNRADHVPFFIFNRYWFRFESNDPVLAFHVDWDDGDDNSMEKSNFQIIAIEKPGFFAVASHIYSKIGTFWPMVRAESENGFISKWYTNDNNTGYKEKVNYKAATGSDTVAHGSQNEFVVREEKTSVIADTSGFRIPHMRPANLPPIAVLKASRKRIVAGIDNEQIEFRSGQKPLLYAWSDSSALTNAGASNCNIKVIMEVEGDDDAQIREYTIPTQTDTTIASGTWVANDLRDDCAPTGAVFGAGILEGQLFTFGTGDTPDIDSDGTPTASNSFNKKFVKFAGGVAGVTATNFIATFYHPIVAQVYTLTISTLADGTGSAMELSAAGTSGAGPYIDVYSTTGGTHRWWLNCSGSQIAPSTPAPGYLEEIDISDAENDPDLGNAAIAALIATNMNNGIATGVGGGQSDQFTVTALLNIITITNTSSAGTAWSATGFATSPSASTFTKVTAGEVAGTVQSLSAHTAIPIQFASGDSNITLADLFATAVNANSNFSATLTSIGGSLHGVTVTQVITGNMVDADNSDVNGSNDTQDIPGLTITTTVPGTTSSGSLNPSRRLYKVKLNDIDTLGDNDRVYIKVHNFDITLGGGSSTSYPQSSDNTVAVLSNGNPIVELNDVLTSAVLDGGESHTRASNVKIIKYLFDLDKNLLTSGAAAHTVPNISNSISELTGIFSDYFNNFADYTKKVTYTYHNTGFSTDSDGRFENFSRLCRLQVKDNSPDFLLDTSANEGDGITASILDLTADRRPEKIQRISLNARKSYTKGAKLTQGSATGYVFRSTFNQNYVELYDTSEISNFDASGTAFTASSTVLVSDTTGDDDDGYPLAISKGNLRIPYRFFKNGTNQAILQTTNRSGISSHANNHLTITTTLNNGGDVGLNDGSLIVTSATGMCIGDILKIGSEYMKILYISTNTLTIKRKYFGTSAAAHTDGGNVYRGTSNLVNATDFNDDGSNPISGGTATAQTWAVSSWTPSNGFNNDMPENFIRMSMQKQFNGVYLRMEHGFKPLIDAGSANGPAKVKINLWYSQYISPNKDSTVPIYDWTPLPFKDYTNELRTSGVLKFLPPEDWAYCTDNDLCENNGTFTTTQNWKGPISNDSAKNAYSPYYHIMVGWSAKNGSNTDTHMAIQNAWPLGNQNSLVIDVVDPHHISLNSIGIAQSISYNRQGKYVLVNDRLGKTDIRRIGAEGGTLTFGGIDLGSDASGRNKFKGYQQNGTPVYLDITHTDSTKTRFFGVITTMSEDMPAGKMKPKYAVTLQCSYCIEMSSAGVMSSDKIAIGGVITDVSKYLLQS